MQLDLYINTLGKHLKSCFDFPVQKIGIDAGFTCPNRDGTLGRGGCTFCNNASFHDQSLRKAGIDSQLNAGREKLRANNYMAYFQAYTNTYAESEVLRQLYQEALQDPDMVGLCVGTRPDCLPDATLELLAEFKAMGYEVWLELGLQTSHNHTLDLINRGHHFDAYVDAVKRAKALGLQVCAHLILGLPGETAADCHTTLDRIVEVGVDGIKLHPLMVVRGSLMAKQYAAGELTVMDEDDYIALAAEMIQRTPINVVYHRIAAQARRPTLIAPEWCSSGRGTSSKIAKVLAVSGVQGSKLGGFTKI
ncbi:TIGR01212 family radical SAM protein [Pelagibaculum spongiae]|uniref:TIGR01212 family radical SAM protein n=1 Tax=Pelagibaculum spongiae TaxID=2080658 RepID=A0A2V1GVQ3_9GAMM|nr:TIGR01212 family radical SAM protein [Pelagibaculum spongiae]PVZ69771.1 TIGR01212 family radical SAM protein [Pelagibaculum spongiae]